MLFQYAGVEIAAEPALREDTLFFNDSTRKSRRSRDRLRLLSELRCKLHTLDGLAGGRRNPVE